MEFCLHGFAIAITTVLALCDSAYKVLFALAAVEGHPQITCHLAELTQRQAS
jgi:hypothetical protein